MTQILLDASVSNQLHNRTHAVETPSSDAVQGENCNAAAETTRITRVERVVRSHEPKVAKRKVKIRRCLKCQENFKSLGDRLCPKCNESNRDVYIPMQLYHLVLDDHIHKSSY